MGWRARGGRGDSVQVELLDRRRTAPRRPARARDQPGPDGLARKLRHPDAVPRDAVLVLEHELETGDELLGGGAADGDVEHEAREVAAARVLAVGSHPPALPDEVGWLPFAHQRA